MKIRLTSLILALSLALIVTGCGKKETEKQVNAGINVTVDEVCIGDIEERISYTGELKASNGSSVSVKVSGSVKSVNVEIGDYVTRGTVLMTIDSTQYSLAYNQALAAYNSAVASYNNITGGSAEQAKLNMNQALANAQIAYDNALQNYNRQKTLYDIGAVSKVNLDSAQTALNNARIALDTAKSNSDLNDNVIIPQTEASASAGINQAKAALDIAASNLSGCTVTAPVSGYITAKNVSVGQMASPGAELFAIKDTDRIDIELNVTEAVIPYITTDTKAYVNIKSAGVENMEALVCAVANAKDARTGMYPVKVTFPNTDGKVKLGMLADVYLAAEGAEGVLTVDSNAIILSADKNHVYIADGGKAVKKEVTVGVSDGKRTQIVSGLSEGDKVIVEGKDFISETNNLINIVK